MNVLGGFKNLNTSGKLLIGFGFLGIILVGVGWEAVDQLGTMQLNAQRIYKGQLEPIVALSVIENDLQRVRQTSYEMFGPIPLEKAREVVAKARQLDADLIEKSDRFETLITSDEGHARFKKFREAMKLYQMHRENKQYAPLLAGLSEKGYQEGAVPGSKFYEAAYAALREAIDGQKAIAEKNYESSQAIYVSSRTLLVGLIVAGLVLGQTFGFIIARMISQPLRRNVKVLEAVAEGDLTQSVPVDSRDEMGRMGAALNAAVADLRESISGISDNAVTLTGSAEQMTTVSVQMSSNAEETSGQASAVSSAAEQVSTSVQTVATGIEEMTISIKEIAKNAHQAAQVANEAVHAAESCTGSIRRLNDSSVEIGKVTKLITSITEQTNLLALNATIEAARAGEAGKGFAVVANEVKELAKGTARATEDIALKIDAIRSDAQNAVQAIAQISRVIHQIDDISTTIASSVEEQTATTSEIGRNVTEAARASTEIARNITGVAEGAKSTSKGAGEAQRAAAQLAALAVELQRLIGRFRCEPNGGPAAKLAPPAARDGAAGRRDDGRPRLDARRTNGRGGLQP